MVDNNKEIKIPYELTEEERKLIVGYGGSIRKTPSMWQRIKDKLGI